LNQVPGELTTIGGVEIAFSPIYGKLNAFAERVLHFDLSVMAGGDLIRHREVLPAVEANAGASAGTRSTFGGHVGLGARIFFWRSMALRLEFKDYLYRVSVLGDSTLQHQLFTELGVSFFLPSGRGAER
jgi:outer membrane beta-barrel protein